MSRRGGTQRFGCHHPGCRESVHVQYDTLRERLETAKSSYYSNWKCVRHAQPEKLLTLDGPAVSVVLECVEENGSHYWREQGKERGFTGFNHSSAHNAYAQDFPVGTVLVVTAYVETPEQAALSAEESLDV